MNRRAFPLRFAAALGLLMLGIGFGTGCCHKPERSTPSPAVAHPLPELINERLLLAREVAWTKFHSGAPIHDPVREAAILADLVAQGRARGLDHARVEAFFSAQIAASREVQTELLAVWRAPRHDTGHDAAQASAHRPAHPPLDLRTDIRPWLDALTPRLLDALPTAPRPDLATATADTLRLDGFSATVITLATDPLR
ncbi:MAG: gamma subclass chorismate mutase AroQ [Burkholderiales bacterium]|nr:gamma subclass chorismate mutase AroQ [Opitutaceae bacterium]